jgi:hypothetical protein
MPVYRGGGGGGKVDYRIKSTTGLRAPGKLVTCARSGALVNESDTVMQNGYRVWIKEADKPTGNPKDD